LTALAAIIGRARKCASHRAQITSRAGDENLEDLFFSHPRFIGLLGDAATVRGK
jgi:hypothetical protein